MEQVQPADTEAGAEPAGKSTQNPPAASEAGTDEGSQAQPQLQPTSAVAAKSATVCGVCQKTASKYKCPRCYLPYCSVACNKTHKENHPPDPEPQLLAEPQSPASPANRAPATLSDLANPFCALDTSEHLQHLFRKYPGLTQQLLDIHAATQPPQEAPDGRIPASLMQNVAKKSSWNHDIGIKNGKEALRRARMAEGEAGEAIREYTELILHLINTRDDEDEVTRRLQQQAAHEDTQLIEQLLAQERR
ncbi:zinc finger (HIT type) family protein [Metarhizium album ARSEF 1941]|uniref:Zinc finger (HIT type) family protein n=1 Tax=Metarhizium album (strain ARSEF 1941) TaxID=1081103 RepID=A0A0B2WPC3_METAS|nr:zinc finger (HIT type) family protein [Metarhizium album ARSEF 1941]KHN95863.1 zinc finger (HIT type) family protein [Metarhizium album ARSEF 1941]